MELQLQWLLQQLLQLIRELEYNFSGGYSDTIYQEVISIMATTTTTTTATTTINIKALQLLLLLQLPEFIQ